jgi:hypothetical protein
LHVRQPRCNVVQQAQLTRSQTLNERTFFQQTRSLQVTLFTSTSMNHQFEADSHTLMARRNNLPCTAEEPSSLTSPVEWFMFTIKSLWQLQIPFSARLYVTVYPASSTSPTLQAILQPHYHKRTRSIVLQPRTMTRSHFRNALTITTVDSYNLLVAGNLSQTLQSRSLVQPRGSPLLRRFGV